MEFSLDCQWSLWHAHTHTHKWKTSTCVAHYLSKLFSTQPLGKEMMNVLFLEEEGMLLSWEFFMWNWWSWALRDGSDVGQWRGGQGISERGAARAEAQGWGPLRHGQALANRSPTALEHSAEEQGDKWTEKWQYQALRDPVFLIQESGVTHQGQRSFS